MKKMRKLLPAFAMLMVSAIMLSTASFAWFTTTASVKATGMSVKAQADGGLVIAGQKVNDDKSVRDPNANEYASSVNVADASMKWWTNDATTIKPTSTDNAGKWYTAVGTTQSNGAAINNAYTSVDAANGKTHYLATKYYFKALQEGTTNYLQVTGISVNATDADRSLDKSIRIALNVGSEWYVFAPKQTGDVDDFFYVGGTTPAKTAYDADDNFYVGAISTTNKVTISESLTSTTPVVVNVYIYYEGEDPNCMSANAVDIQTLAIELDFASEKYTPAP